MEVVDFLYKLVGKMGGVTLEKPLSDYLVLLSKMPRYCVRLKYFYLYFQFLFCDMSKILSCVAD